MEQLILFTLLYYFVGIPVISEACPTATFYITPTNANNPDCLSDCPCVTLDDLATNQLPQVRNTDSLSLIFLKGVHDSTVTMNFEQIQHVSMTTLNTFKDLGDTQTLIRLLSSNITVTDAAIFEMEHLAIHSGGPQSLFLLKKDFDSESDSWTISLNSITVFGILFQLVPWGGNVKLDVKMMSVVFKISTIELHMPKHIEDQRNNIVHIKNSIFLQEIRPQYNSLVILSPQYLESQLVLVKLDNVSFSDLEENLPKAFGGFEHPVAPADVYIGANVQMFSTNSQFTSSYGRSTAINAKNLFTNISNCTFSGYTQGALIFTDVSEHFYLLIDSTRMFNNSIRTGGTAGAALQISSYGTTEIKNSFFHRNIDLNGNSQIIKLFKANKMKVHNSVFAENNGTVINTKDTNIIFSGEVSFDSNLAYQGAALSLQSSTFPGMIKINIAEHTTVTFRNNTAKQFGGALFLDSSTAMLLSENNDNEITWCFYAPLNDTSGFRNITFSFNNNSAGKGGDHIYGISVRNYCKVVTSRGIEDETWRRLFHIQFNTSLSPVTSNPLRVCVCDSYGSPLCDNESGIFVTNYTAYPGERFSINTVIVGAEFGTTIGQVYASLLPTLGTSIQGSLGDPQEHIKLVTYIDRCTPLTYSLHSHNPYEIIYLTVQERALNYYGNTEEIRKSIQKYKTTDIISVPLLTAPVFINITIRLPCPRGFSLVGTPPYCECYPQLSQWNISCKITNGIGYISHLKNIWIGASKEGVYFGDHCKVNHCRRKKVWVDLDNPDVQCSFNHSGVLCGGCSEGYSVAIGSTNCLYCPNNNHLALLPFFLLAGPLLYMFIAAFDFTITNGAINGLVFYANILWIYHTTLFPNFNNESFTTSGVSKLIYFSKVFIAWLNLDFGIETCFINGLDAYWKSLLQYCFPIYIWIIAYIVILMYRHTNINHRFLFLRRLFGNPTDVLVTFIFLSYTKFVRKIEHSFGFAILTSLPDNSTEIVWGLDGNIKYCRGRHIFMFVSALFVLVACLAYSVYILRIGLKNNNISAVCKCNHFLTSRQHVDDRPEGHDQDNEQKEGLKASFKAQLRRMKRTLKLSNMPLPLYNAHYASLHNKHKYWLGLMLFVRIALLITFTTADNLAPKLNPFVLLFVATVLLVYIASNSIYNDRYVQVLEAVSLGNLILISGGITYANLVNSREWTSAIVCFSVGIAFLQFSGLVLQRLIRCLIRKKNKRTTTHHPAANVDLPHENAGQDGQLIRRRLGDISGWRESLIDDAPRNNNDSADENEPLLIRVQNKRNIFQHLSGCCGY